MLGLRRRAGWQRRRPDDNAIRSTSCCGSRRSTTSRRGRRLGPGSPGLAHRVLGAGPARARHDHRSPRRRLRPDLPASRVRAGAVGGGHRASRSCATGCTRRWFAWTVRRCRSRLGNLVFVSELRKEWDPMAIRLVLVENHYRTGWEWDDDADASGRWSGSSDGAPRARVTAPRRRPSPLDDDLDTPAAVAAIDAAAGGGEGVSAAAALLGVVVATWSTPPHGGRRRRPRVREAHPVAKAVLTPGLPGLWRFTVPGIEQLPAHRWGDLLPQPHLGDRLLLPAHGPAAPDHLRGQGRVHGLVEDEAPLPGHGHDPDRPQGRRTRRSGRSTRQPGSSRRGSSSASTRRARGPRRSCTGVTPGRPASPCAPAPRSSRSGSIGTRDVQPPDAQVPRPFKPVEIALRPTDRRRSLRDRADDRMVLRQIIDEVMYEIRDLTGQEYVDEYATKKAEASPPPSGPT